MKYCEKCDKEGAKYVKEYDGYLCDSHAQHWLIKNEENEKNGLKAWYKSMEIKL